MLAEYVYQLHGNPNPGVTKRHLIGKLHAFPLWELIFQGWQVFSFILIFILLALKLKAAQREVKMGTTSFFLPFPRSDGAANNLTHLRELLLDT